MRGLKKSAKETAADILGRRPLSERELLKKLSEKGFSQEECAGAAERMRGLGALNDAEYAKLLARHYSRRGFGAGRITEELRRRGVDREHWSAALDEAPPSDERVDAELKRRLGASFDEKDIKRATDFLYRRGFSWREISAALKRYRDSISEEQ